jgi:hypothetical protein
VLRVLAIAVSLVIAVSLLWMAAETHYRGCVEAATARTDRLSGDDRVLDQLAEGGARVSSIEGCSRLPF